MDLFLPVFSALNAAKTRYMVVGGVACVLHGHMRLTADLDLMVDLEADAARRAVSALTDFGYRPVVPVDPFDLCDPDIRKIWIEEKNMVVMGMHDPENPLRSLDLFIAHPMSFEDLFARSVLMHVGSTAVRTVSLPDLIALKRLSGRPRDLEDIAELERLAGGSG